MNGFIDVFSIGSGIIAVATSYLAKHAKYKFDCVNSAQPIDDTEEGLVYVEGEVSSPNPLKVRFQNIDYKLLAQSKTVKTVLQPVFNSHFDETVKVYSTSKVFAQNITIDKKYTISSTFFKENFRFKTLDFFDSGKSLPVINYNSDNLTVCNRTETETLNGVLDKQQYLVIGDLRNGEIIQSDRYNYAGEETYEEHKNRLNDEHKNMLIVHRFWTVVYVGCLGFTMWHRL